MPSTPNEHLRNVAIIAHVDHGKTTLVDAILAHTGTLAGAAPAGECVLDSDPLERERGITIFSKNCTVTYRPAAGGGPIRVNLIDTPGHADFGGEVERVLRMADGALLLVDAFEGPMPQTRFVLGKALELGLRLIVVINKCDRPDARPDAVVDEVFDLLVALGADDETLDFPVVYASGRAGWASTCEPAPGGTMEPLLEAIVGCLPPPTGDPDAPLQMLITTIDYSEYVGRIAIGRVYAGKLVSGQLVALCCADETLRPTRALRVHRFEGLGRVPAEGIEAGDLCAVEGLGEFEIGDTVACPERPEVMSRVAVDEPTLHMQFRINDSPLAGSEGRFVTSRQLAERLQREVRSNVALRVEPGETPEEFKVSGRGLLHLGVLLENMRREGYELAVGRPEVIVKEIDGRKCEPIEVLTLDVASDALGPAMELLGTRGAEVQSVETRGDRMHVVCEIPARALIGLRSRMLTATGGEAIMYHAFLRYAPLRSGERHRASGVMIATESGQSTTYALLSLADRGIMFIRAQERIYEGQVVGEHSRENDLTVNVVRAKAFSNVRESTKEATVTLKAPRILSLEAALEYIEDDELVEITPSSIRLRKRMLTEADRRRAGRREKSRSAAASG
ncbi:MAG: translational GTPase TypA [Planctomycetota bacterium]|jgi:GTP-binding protein